MQQLFINVDKKQLEFLESKIALMNYISTDAGFYESVKSYIKSGMHPVHSYELVEQRYEMLFGERRYSSFEKFVENSKKLGHDNSADFFNV